MQLRQDPDRDAAADDGKRPVLVFLVRLGLRFGFRGRPLVGQSLDARSRLLRIDAVRTTVLQRGGKIAREPFALGKLATIMFVEGPDGILFEFVGPMLERLKK